MKKCLIFGLIFLAMLMPVYSLDNIWQESWDGNSGWTDFESPNEPEWKAYHGHAKYFMKKFNLDEFKEMEIVINTNAPGTYLQIPTYQYLYVDDNGRTWIREGNDNYVNCWVNDNLIGTFDGEDNKDISQFLTKGDNIVVCEVRQHEMVYWSNGEWMAGRSWFDIQLIEHDDSEIKFIANRNMGYWKWAGRPLSFGALSGTGLINDFGDPVFDYLTLERVYHLEGENNWLKVAATSTPECYVNNVRVNNFEDNYDFFTYKANIDDLVNNGVNIVDCRSYENGHNINIYDMKIVQGEVKEIFVPSVLQNREYVPFDFEDTTVYGKLNGKSFYEGSGEEFRIPDVIEYTDNSCNYVCDATYWYFYSTIYGLVKTIDSQYCNGRSDCHLYASGYDWGEPSNILFRYRGQCPNGHWESCEKSIDVVPGNYNLDVYVVDENGLSFGRNSNVKIEENPQLIIENIRVCADPKCIEEEMGSEVYFVLDILNSEHSFGSDIEVEMSVNGKSYVYYSNIINFVPEEENYDLKFTVTDKIDSDVDEYETEMEFVLMEDVVEEHNEISTGTPFDYQAGSKKEIPFDSDVIVPLTTIGLLGGLGVGSYLVKNRIASSILYKSYTTKNVVDIKSRQESLKEWSAKFKKDALLFKEKCLEKLKSLGRDDFDLLLEKLKGLNGKDVDSLIKDLENIKEISSEEKIKSLDNILLKYSNILSVGAEKNITDYKNGLATTKEVEMVKSTTGRFFDVFKNTILTIASFMGAFSSNITYDKKKYIKDIEKNIDNYEIGKRYSVPNGYPYNSIEVLLINNHKFIFLYKDGKLDDVYIPTDAADEMEGEKELLNSITNWEDIEGIIETGIIPTTISLSYMISEKDSSRKSSINQASKLYNLFDMGKGIFKKGIEKITKTDMKNIFNVLFDKDIAIYAGSVQGTLYYNGNVRGVRDNIYEEGDTIYNISPTRDMIEMIDSGEEGWNFGKIFMKYYEKLSEIQGTGILGTGLLDGLKIGKQIDRFKLDNPSIPANTNIPLDKFIIPVGGTTIGIPFVVKVVPKIISSVSTLNGVPLVCIDLPIPGTSLVIECENILNNNYKNEFVV